MNGAKDKEDRGARDNNGCKTGYRKLTERLDDSKYSTRRKRER